MDDSDFVAFLMSLYKYYHKQQLLQLNQPQQFVTVAAIASATTATAATATTVTVAATAATAAAVTVTAMATISTTILHLGTAATISTTIPSTVVTQQQPHQPQPQQGQCEDRQATWRSIMEWSLWVMTELCALQHKATQILQRAYANIPKFTNDPPMFETAVNDDGIVNGVHETVVSDHVAPFAAGCCCQ